MSTGPNVLGSLVINVRECEFVDRYSKSLIMYIDQAWHIWKLNIFHKAA